MNKRVLEVNHATMRFGGLVAVSDLSMHIDSQEIVALIGPNGAGKTTAFNMITGVYAPTNGAIFFNGEQIISNHPQGNMKKLYQGGSAGKFPNVMVKLPDVITKLGIARTFQNIRLFKDLTVFENVLIAKHMRSKAGVFAATFRLNAKEERAMRAETMRLLEILELADLRDETASNLPYGKQRRLEIARALATEPSLLLLDEPAAGMNPNETQELMDTIRLVRDKFDVTILLIEHDMRLVSGICDRLTVLNFGTVLAQGKVKDVLNDPEVVRAYLGGE